LIITKCESFEGANLDDNKYFTLYGTWNIDQVRPGFAYQYKNIFDPFEGREQCQFYNVSGYIKFNNNDTCDLNLKYSFKTYYGDEVEIKMELEYSGLFSADIYHHSESGGILNYTPEHWAGSVELENYPEWCEYIFLYTEHTDSMTLRVDNKEDEKAIYGIEYYYIYFSR